MSLPRPSAAVPSDPLAALRANPIRIERDKTVRYFRNAPVREWIELGSLRTAALSFGYAKNRRELALGVASGAVSGEELAGWSHALVEEVTGWRWWEASTLLVTSGGRSVLGRLTLAGVDPDRTPLGPWCAAVWAVLTEHADAKQIQRLETELSLPPEGYEDAWDDDEQYAAAMLAQAGRFGA